MALNSADPMERWSSWFCFNALPASMLLREGNLNCDMEVRKMSSASRVLVHRFNDVDIWQGPQVLEWEFQNMERTLNCSRDLLLFRFTY